MVCYYAQLDENDIVVSVSQLSGEVDSLNMIRIDSFDETLLKKRYNHETGEFEEVPQPEPIETPTIAEQIYAETMYQTALLEMQVFGRIGE